MRTGTFVLGPTTADLRVHTTRAGLASRAGHDLLLHVTRWEATLVLGDAASLELTADPRSLVVRSGSGGVKPLSDGDRRDIVRNIDADVLGGEPIAFRSTGAWTDGDRVQFEGQLTLAGRMRPSAFELTAGEDGTLTAQARVVQSAWGIKPYSGLFGALKVADEVLVDVVGRFPSGAAA